MGSRSSFFWFIPIFSTLSMRMKKKRILVKHQGHTCHDSHFNIQLREKAMRGEGIGKEARKEEYMNCR